MKPSPLDSVLEVREQRADDARAQVSAARRMEDATESALRARKLEVETHQTEMARVEQEESQRLSQGMLRVADLQARAAWRAAEADRAVELERLATDAGDARLAAERNRIAAENVLLSSEVERKVVASHIEKQAHIEARAKDNAADDEMLESWRRKTQ